MARTLGNAAEVRERRIKYASPTSPEALALNRYNHEMCHKFAQNDFKQAEQYAIGLFGYRDTYQVMNHLIDAAMEICGHPYYKGSAVRLAMWCQDSPTFQHKCESFLSYFRL